MFCPNCGQESNSKFCANCGAKMPENFPVQQLQQPTVPPIQPPVFKAQPMQYAAPPKKSNTGLIIAIIVGGIFFLVLLVIIVGALSKGSGSDSLSGAPQDSSTSAVSVEESDTTPTETEVPEMETPETEAPETETPEANAGTISFDQAFEFDDLEITISSDIKWVKLDNMLSELDGQEVIEIPISITNKGSDTNGLSILSFKQFAPDGNELDSIWFFFNNDVFSAGNIRVGATQNTYLHLLYKGDGDYVIEFSEFWGETTEIVLPIKK